MTSTNRYRSMGFMVKAFLAAVCLLWLFAGAVACAQPGAESGQEMKPMQEKPIEDVLKEHTDSLMALPGVVGTAQGLCEGEPCIRVFVVEAAPDLLKQIPSEIEGYAVDIVETGVIRPLDRG